jgi:hypothetical protein
MLWVLIIALVLLVVLSIFGFFYFQLRRKKSARAPQLKTEGGERWGICARCGQNRLIVKKEMNLCAFCWSSLNTKQIA